MADIEINRHPEYSDYGADLDGNIYSFKFGRIRLIRDGKHPRGYRQFRLSFGRYDSKMYLVHRFVYECWTKEIIDSDLQCNHNDHNKTNNAFYNLSLMTDAENREHREAAGRPTGGAAHKKYKLKYGYEMD
jgi:hypothetical protein